MYNSSCLVLNFLLVLNSLGKTAFNARRRAGNMVGLATLCASMDMDGSGSLSLEEMLEGFESSEDFQKLMHCMAT